MLAVGLFSLITVVATEAMAVSTVMPLVEDDLGDLWLYGWVFSAFQLGTLVGIVLGGRAADRTNPAMPLGVGLGVFCAGLLVAGFAPSMAVLVAGRTLQGLGAGVIPTVAYVCVGRGFQPIERPRVFALLSTAWVLPSLVAPLLASTVASAAGWRWVFLGLVPVAVLVGGIAVAGVRTLGHPGVGDVHAPEDQVGLHVVLRLTLGAALVLSGSTSDTFLAGVPLALAGFVLLVPAFARLTPPGTLRLRPRLPAAVGLRGLLTFAFFASDAFVPLALTSVRGRSTIYAGFVLGASAVAWAIGSWVQARLTESWGAARLVRLGAGALVFSQLVFLVGLSESVPTAVWFVGAALGGFGIGVAYSPLSVVTLAEAEPGREGRATTALQLSDVLGVALGTGLAGAIVAVGERTWDTNAPALAVVLLVSTAVAVLLGATGGRLAASASAPSRVAG